ncbi:MAG: cyclase family protein [Bacteroidota bacterium]
MQNKLIDLTHILNEKITVYPDTLRPAFEVLNTVEKNDFAELKMTMVLHSGTHIDAPCHIVKNTKSLDLFPIDKFIGSAIVIPCRDRKEIDVNFLKKFETKISRVDFILFFTGWQYKWNRDDYFENCPIPTQEAARWLTKFNLKGIGIDSFSVDRVFSAEDVTSENLPNHHILLEKEIILVENLTNLDKLPDKAFSFQCLPLNIEHADGSPVRAIAMIND